MGDTKIPNECLWGERWPVWDYVGVVSAQSSSFGPHLPNQKLLPMPLLELQHSHSQDSELNIHWKPKVGR